MDDWQWQDNAKGMFDHVVTKTPMPFRSPVKKRLLEILSEGAETSKLVTEDSVIDAVSRTIPEPFGKKSVAAISEMRQSASL